MDEVADFELAGKSEWDIAQELERNLWLKGFCVLEPGLSQHLDDAVEELQQLSAAGEVPLDPLQASLRPPPFQVLEGLLGAEGSEEVAWFDPSKASVKMQALQSVAQELVQLADYTEPFFDSQGVSGVSLSEMLIIKAGEVDEESGSELTEVACSKWISTFLAARLMLVYFMGPGEGLLELLPLDEDAEPMTLRTQPDMLVVLRSDIVARKHLGSKGAFALCAWLMLPNVTGPRGWEALSSDETDAIPGVRELSDWAEARCEVLANLDSEDALVNLPRSWQRMVRAKYFKPSNMPIAICGMSTHSPGTRDADILWKSLNQGTDFITEVPFRRWDHAEYYDPDPNCYVHSTSYIGGKTMGRTNIKHGQFIEGVELFDNKFFQVSQSEATGMEPQQRHILETSYEALYTAGYTKKKMMGSYIAVFTGCTNPEAMYMNYPTGAGAGNISQAITSNRTSFVFGINGPSSSIDCEMASSHMALMVGCSAVAPNNDRRLTTGGYSEAAVVGGVYIALTPFMWPRFNAYMNPAGRCLTFDASANGYVRGESCSSVCQKPYAEKVDNRWSLIEDAPCIGSMVGWRMTCNGRSASLTAPHAPSQQEAVQSAIREAGIDVLDLDAVECHGSGGLLDDAVEVSALSKLLRYDEAGSEEPLLLGAVKTQVSAQQESCGMSQFLKVMLNIAYASNVPSLHLRQINPHIEMDSDGVFMPTEHVAYRAPCVFHGMSSRGFSGTNTHIIQGYKVDGDRVPTDRAPFSENRLSFWPAGGGMLDAAARPSGAYHIAGSWNHWTPEEMVQNSDGAYIFTLTLGANGFEVFQIWLDGDEERVLHPSTAGAPSGSAVSGPSGPEISYGRRWMIDSFAAQQPSPALQAEAPEQAGAADGDLPVATVSSDTTSAAGPGDQYEVKLSVAGKFRAITWQRLSRSFAMDEALAERVLGSYFVASTCNKWQPEEMVRQPIKEVQPGRAECAFVLEMRLPPYCSNCEFVILRNRDWEQVFYPAAGQPTSNNWDAEDVAGPDTGLGANTWCLEGRSGDKFRIEFFRSVGNSLDTRRISWQIVESA